MRRCQCPIHVYGTLGGQTIRRALDQTSWDAATELILGWTASGEIGVVKAEAPSVRDAITKFLADCDARHLGWEAKRNTHHLLEDRLLSWCESKGLSNLRQLTVDALRQFRQSWKDSPLYATKNLERLRAFLRFCQQAGWIKQNPATSVKPPKVTASPTLPFSRAEMKRIIDACDDTAEQGPHPRVRVGHAVHRAPDRRCDSAVQKPGVERHGLRANCQDGAGGHRARATACRPGSREGRQRVGAVLLDGREHQVGCVELVAVPRPGLRARWNRRWALASLSRHVRC